MELNATVLVCGADTLIGSAIVRMLRRYGYDNVIADNSFRGGDGAVLSSIFEEHRPSYVVVAAGRSGGISANRRYPADLMRDNLEVCCTTMSLAWQYSVEKLLYLASSCCYPKHCPQPMAVSSLFTGPLEPTSASYATAKLAGIQLCAAYRQQYGARFIAAIPADVYGPSDSISIEDAHVVAALIAKMHEAKVNGAPRCELWGTGSPRREFLFSEDLADACIHVLKHYDEAMPINLGGGVELSIADLAEEVRLIVQYDGHLDFDASKPDGSPRKLLDSSTLLGLNWSPRTELRYGLMATYDAYLSHLSRLV